MDIIRGSAQHEPKKYFRRADAYGRRCNRANEFEHQSRKREIKKKKERRREVEERQKSPREMGCPNEWVERVNDR